jgi:hypothetical protein
VTVPEASLLCHQYDEERRAALHRLLLSDTGIRICKLIINQGTVPVFVQVAPMCSLSNKPKEKEVLDGKRTTHRMGGPMHSGRTSGLFDDLSFAC